MTRNDLAKKYGVTIPTFKKKLIALGIVPKIKLTTFDLILIESGIGEGIAISKGEVIEKYNLSRAKTKELLGAYKGFLYPKDILELEKKLQKE